MSIYIFGSGGGGGTSGTDTSNDTVEGKYVLNPYTFHDKNGNAGTGLIYNWDGTILAGASTDGNKVTVQPSQSVRHIAAGSYINREIELAAMPAGSVALSQSGNKVTATKTAGYIGAGSQDITLAAGSTSLSRSGATVTLTRQAGYITSGTQSLTVPLVANYTVDITQNGQKTVPALDGTAGFSSLIINTSVAGSTPSLQNRSVTITQNTTTTYYATGTYDGMYSLTVTTNVPSAPSQSIYFDGATGSTLSGKSVTIGSKSTIQMVSMISNSTASNIISSVMAWRGGSSVYYYVNGQGRSDAATASWSNSSVTLTFTGSYSLSGSYRIVYAYLA